MKKKGPKPQSAEARFFARVFKQENGCWLYGGPEFGNKYGQISSGGRNGTMTTTHRFSYRLHKGEIPLGHVICHKCDVRNCVNPDHLYAGTHEDNTRDIVERGRTAKNSGRVVKTLLGRRYRLNRKLSNAHRQRVKDEYASGTFTMQQLASRYRVSQATISATIRDAKNMGLGGSVNAKREGNFRRTHPVEMQKQVCDMYATGDWTQTAIAEFFGCNQAYVSYLIRKHKET